MSPPVKRRWETTTAQAVVEHANRFHDEGRWYVIAECMDASAVLEELEHQ